jgi:hypothetical protein
MGESVRGDHGLLGGLAVFEKQRRRLGDDLERRRARQARRHGS